MSDKLHISNEMKNFDLKNRNFYKSLNDEEQKKFSNYLMLRWGASVEGSTEMQEYYLISTNEKVNVNFFDIAKHPELQWLTCTSVSPNLGSQKHYWLGTKKKESNNKVIKFLRSLRPDLSDFELEILASINSTTELKDYAKCLGMTDEQIKKEL